MRVRFDSTYEGLKPEEDVDYYVPGLSFDSTYEGLKHMPIGVRTRDLQAFRQYL